LDREDPDAQTLVRKIRAGLLSSMTFAFKVTGQRWSDDGALRTITAVDINRGDGSWSIRWRTMRPPPSMLARAAVLGPAT